MVYELGRRIGGVRPSEDTARGDDAEEEHRVLNLEESVSGEMGAAGEEWVGWMSLRH